MDDTTVGPAVVSGAGEWSFVVLRALAMLGGMVALFLVPLRPEHQPHLVPLAWAFVAYELVLFLAIWAWPAALRALLLISIAADLAFVALFVWHSGGAESHFYLLFYLLVALVAVHFSPGVGLAAAAGACLAYVLVSLTDHGAPDWHHVGARLATFFLLSGSLGYLSQRERVARETAEGLNTELRAQQARLERAYAELRAAQERLMEAERLAAIGQMSAKVSHEIRNPLGSISLNAELLEDELQSLPGDRRSEAARLMAAIRSQLDVLQGVTEEYLRFARMPKPTLEPVALQDLIRELGDFARPELASKKVELRLELPDEPLMLSVDPGQIRRALLNLIRNAVEAMPEGGVLRVIARRRTADGGDAAEAVVEDSGAGIHPGDAERIFEPFFTTKEGGTGLGLAVARQIAADHGGRLTWEPGVEGGTRFCLMLPVPGGGATR
jgi:signal transduction histidine kinase